MPKKPPSPFTVKTIPEVASFFGVRADTIRKTWRPAWGPGCKTAAGYDLRAIAQWDRSRRHEPTDTKAELNKQQAEVDLAISQQALIERERKNRQAEGALIDRFISESQVKSGLRQLRDVLLEIPSNMIPLMGEQGTVVAAEFRRQAERVLADFSDQMQLSET